MNLNSFHFLKCLSDGPKQSSSPFMRMVWQSMGCLLLLTSAAVAGPGATLEWDSSPEPGVSGYKLYFGLSSGVYTDSVDARNATTVFVPTLVSGFTYFFVVRAYNDTGESPSSNEVRFTVPAPDGLELTYLPRAPVPAGPGTVTEFTPVSESLSQGFAFIVSAAEQTAVTVYASENLQTWEVQGTVPNPTGRLMIRDLNSIGRARKFYRLTSTIFIPVED